jgi:hypothetical protein
MRIFRAIVLDKFSDREWLQQFAVVGVLPDELDYNINNLFLYLTPIKNVIKYKEKSAPPSRAGFLIEDAHDLGLIKSGSPFFCRSTDLIGEHLLLINKQNGKHRYHNQICRRF